MELFLQIGFLIILASALALLLSLLKVPPIISYILAGVIAGFFGLKPDSEEIEIMVEFGIILLLFLAGLEIKLKGFLELGKKTAIIGEGHDLIMAVVGFMLAFFVFQLDMLASFYLAIGLTLSSTIVVVKALTNRKELSTPHGKILIGTMVLQDIVAMLSIAIFSSLGTGSTILEGIGIMFVKGIFIFMILFVLGKFVLPKVFFYAAESIELVFLVALGWLFLGVGISGFIGFSVSIGAFLAALAISDLPFSFEINDKTRGIRDFGILLFFLSVGFQLEISKEIFFNWQFYALIAFVMLFTPFITSIIAGFLKFTKKEIFLISMLPTQVSEFTLILMTFGLTAGHVSTEIYSMVTLVIIATIMLSSWIIGNLNKIYKNIQHKLDFLEWEYAEHPPHLKKNLKNHVVIFGFTRLGANIANFFKKKKRDVLVVDWQPESIKAATHHKCLHVFGDAGDSDLWEEISLNKAAIVISTIGKNQEDDLNLLEWLKEHNSKCLKITESNDKKEARQLYKSGSDFVLVHDDLEWNDLKLYLESSKQKKAAMKKKFRV
ncbi:cation:proton antiporter [Candidatus Woesearchaeota archaeon]|nr:cation:proton antiporter [Candidatus Woesearchaeota archaeon]